MDFKYTLNTGAGFEINRKGLGSVTAVGGTTQVTKERKGQSASSCLTRPNLTPRNKNEKTQALLCVATENRFKETEPLLRETAESFRVFAGVADSA